MWPAGATVGRQPSRCVFEMNPWREFYGCRYPPSFASTKMGYLRTTNMPCCPTGSANRRPLPPPTSSWKSTRTTWLWGAMRAQQSNRRRRGSHCARAIEDRLPCLGLLERRRTDLRPKVSRAGSEAATAGGASPEFTLAIDWTMSAPGFSWPVSYHLVWTPIYERFVVTASADCPDAFGYADFVLGKAQTNQGNFCRTRSVNAPSSRKRSLMAA
jgi:hypothetical protein